MSRTIKIPECMNPFVVNVNGRVYSYPGGSTQTVPDEVAEVIELHNSGHIVAISAKPGYYHSSTNTSHDIWKQWESRLAMGMDVNKAPVPFCFDGQVLVDGTIMAHNNGTKDKNRWGFHVLEGYAKDNYSRITMLVDKHSAEAESKPSAEAYYYIGADHKAGSYGNMKIGSDVAFHSFCFDRDKMTGYGEIDCRMPITLARISLSKDLDTSYETVDAADAAYEPELYPEENNRCLRYIALKKAANGAMFYDIDRNQVACKVNGQWCSVPVTTIDDSAFDIFKSTTEIKWTNGVVDGNGSIVENTARLYTEEYLPANATAVNANEGYAFCVIPYNGAGITNAPNPYYDATNNTFSGNIAWYTAVDLTTLNLGTGWIESETEFTNYRLVAKRTDGANIDTSEGSNIVVTCG